MCAPTFVNLKNHLQYFNPTLFVLTVKLCNPNVFLYPHPFILSFVAMSASFFASVLFDLYTILLNSEYFKSTKIAPFFPPHPNITKLSVFKSPLFQHYIIVLRLMPPLNSHLHRFPTVRTPLYSKSTIISTTYTPLFVSMLIANYFIIYSHFVNTLFIFICYNTLVARKRMSIRHLDQ